MTYDPTPDVVEVIRQPSPNPAQSVYRAFGETLRGLKTTAEELPDYVERILRRFQAGREPGESFAAWTVRASEQELS